MHFDEADKVVAQFVIPSVAERSGQTGFDRLNSQKHGESIYKCIIGLSQGGVDSEQVTATGRYRTHRPRHRHGLDDAALLDPVSIVRGVARTGL